jgi:hypothetical protein
MPVEQQNLRDLMLERIKGTKQAQVEALKKRIGPPPKSVAGRAQRNDEYTLFWQLGDGWEDPQKAELMAQQMTQQGAKPQDILMAQYPKRVPLLSTGERRGNLDAQVKFCEEMIRKRAEGTAKLLEQSMREMEKEAGGVD